MSIKNSIKQYGYFNSFKRLLKLLIGKFGIKYESFWYMVNTTVINAITQKMCKYSYEDVIELNFDDFKNADPHVFSKKKLNLIRSRFESDNFRCYGIIDNRVLVYSFWITTNKISFPSKYKKSLLLDKNEGFLEDAYCHPLYRRKGFHSKMTLYNLLQLHKLDRSKNIVLVLSENRPAYKANLKSGFKTEKKIIFISIFGKTYYIEKYL